MTISDGANAVTAVCAFIALCFGAYTFSKQKSAGDVGLILGIFDKINSYWDHFVAENDDQKQRYYLGQILSYYENSCFLANKEIISSLAFRCVADHIYEVWQKLQSNEQSKAIVDELVSAPTTFCEIKQFIREYQSQNGLCLSWRERVFLSSIGVAA